MYFSTIIFVLFLGLPSTALSQDDSKKYLVISSNYSDVEQKVQEGLKIKVWTASAEIEGKFQLIDEKQIQIDQTNIKLDEIVAIKAKSRRQKVIGGVVTAISPTIIVTFTALVLGDVIDELGGLIWGVVGSSVSTALIPVGLGIALGRKKKMIENSTSSGYKLSIEI